MKAPGWTLHAARPQPASRLAAVEVRNLGVDYGARCALRDVSFDVRVGEITALIGPSGCGKTSLLNALNRMTDLVPGCRVSGQALIDGVDVHAAQTDVRALRRKVGMVFQRPQPFPLSIANNLDLPLREHGVRSSIERAGRIERALHDVGLWREVRDRLHTPALGLSGGQRQRLCIARTIALEPTILLLDEPCSALDPQASAVVEELIARWRGRYTVMIVTHNLAQARRIADQVAMFWTQDNSGVLIEHATNTKIFEQPEHPITAAYVRGQRG